MKILWHSNAPFAATGYGQQTALAAKALADEHDVAISCFYGLAGGVLEWEGLRLYPAGSDVYGNDVVFAHAVKHFGEKKLDGGLVLTLVDVWVLNPGQMARGNVACWVPVDHDPAPPKVVEFLRESGAVPVAMSRYGQRALARELDAEPLYVPHAIDVDNFKPRDRAEARLRMGLSEDAFVVTMVAANKGKPPRKGFPEAFAAFAQLREKHKDALLYLHTEAVGIVDGVNLPNLLEACSVPPESVRFVDQYHHFVLGCSPEHMAWTYSASDVLLSPSYGEGFGVPIIEAQACGTPVVVTDHTAMPELASAGWRVGGQPVWTYQDSWQKVPDVDELAWALGEAYDRAEQLRAGARTFALDYAAPKVYREHWQPAMAEIEARLFPEVVVPTAVERA